MSRKLPKTRILKIEFISTCVYSAQYKGIFFWHDIEVRGETCYYDSFNEAKKAIDTFLRKKGMYVRISDVIIKYP